MEAARLRTELARLDTAERALISELEAPADPGDPDQQRPIRHRPPTPGRAALRRRDLRRRPGPHPAGPLPRRPPGPGPLHHQVTIHATLTSDTPRTIAALLGDPRTDDDSPADPATSTDTFSHLGPFPLRTATIHTPAARCQVLLGLATVHAADLPVGQLSRDRPCAARLNPCGQFLDRWRGHHVGRRVPAAPTCGRRGSPTSPARAGPGTASSR